MTDVQYVYTLSSDGRLVENCIRSIHSLTEQVPSEDVTVFYTPPVTDRDTEALRKLGVDLRIEENETTAFSIMDQRDDHEERNYAEKIKLCSVEADTVVFLDCDTQVAGDIESCVTGAGRFRARPDPLDVGDRWPELFERHDKPLLDWMPNAGFLVFKDGLHREIEDEWRRLVATDLNYSRMGLLPKEQVALALAVSKFDTGQLSPREHVIEWMDERRPDGVVYHHSAPKRIARKL